VETLEKTGSSPSLLIIIAALNEERGIGPSLEDLRTVLPKTKYLVVDGNSSDRTVEYAREMGAEILFQKSKGKGAAIAQAIKSVNVEFKYVIFTDADYTYPAESIPEMIRILEDNPDVGMVCGNRFTNNLTSTAMRSFFFIGNRFLAWTQRIINGVHLEDPLTGLRVIRWGILKDWEPKSKGFDIEAEMNHRVDNKGYTIVEIPIQYRDRMGAKKLKLRDGLMILRRIVAESLA